MNEVLGSILDLQIEHLSDWLFWYNSERQFTRRSFRISAKMKIRVSGSILDLQIERVYFSKRASPKHAQFHLFL